MIDTGGKAVKGRGYRRGLLFLFFREFFFYSNMYKYVQKIDFLAKNRYLLPLRVRVASARTRKFSAGAAALAEGEHLSRVSFSASYKKLAYKGVHC